MDLHLNGKKVLVTGASKGLGLEIVKALIKEGAFVTMCSRNRSSLEKAKSFLSAKERVFIHPADATCYDEVTDCVQSSVKSMGGLDILINNAGGAIKYSGFFNLEDEDWLAAYQLNVMSIVHFVKAAYLFLKRSKQARIINISSLTGIQPGMFNPHYSVNKAALINLSKHLANILASDNILVNCVVPGTFASDAWSKNIERVAIEEDIAYEVAEQKEIDLATQSIPLKRIGNSNDIVPMILVLASTLSSWTTGSYIVIDGGKMKCIYE